MNSYSRKSRFGFISKRVSGGNTQLRLSRPIPGTNGYTQMLLLDVERFSIGRQFDNTTGGYIEVLSIKHSDDEDFLAAIQRTVVVDVINNDTQETFRYTTPGAPLRQPNQPFWVFTLTPNYGDKTPIL